MIGIPLVKKLIDLGSNVRVVSMDTEERAKQVLPEGIEFRRLDLTEKNNCLEAVKDQQYVFHLAGIKGSVALGRSKAATWFTPLILFNTNMMDAAFKSGVERYLYTSSIGVYPEANIFYEDDAWNGQPFSADVFPGWAKRIGELQAEAYKLEHGWDNIAIVRPANVYGKYDNFNPETAMVIGSLIGKFAKCKGNPVEVWGDGSPKRDFIYSEDVADGMLKALEYGANCIPINLGSGNAISIKELAVVIAEIFGYDENIIKFNIDKPSGESIRLMSVERAEKMIGFKSKTDIRQGIKETIDWYLNNINFDRYNVFN